MKPWVMPCKATQHRRVMVESSDKMWSTGEGNGKPLKYSCLENPMNSMKRQKDRTLKDEIPRLVQFSHSVMSNFLRPHESQHARPRCLSPTPGVYSNSCPLSRWRHPTISSSSSPSPLALSLSQLQGLFKRVSSSHQVARVLKFQFQHQHQSFQWMFRTDFL